MGPFVPDIFSGELNYIIALIIGIAFGFILEQAGFSASRKLAGLFYGYDFTVLKVFFTAAIVAMFGIVLFNYFGLLNIDIIFVNPTFMPSAIVGGVIMGLGFIIGGFCPGTSICGAVIGKIDAIFFIFGILIGIFIFTVSYPSIETLYKGGNEGSLLVFNSLGISKGLFIFLLVVVAIGAFIFTSIIEKKVNRATEHPEKKNFKKYYAAIATAVVIAFIMIFLPDWKTKITDNAATMAQTEKEDINYMTADELAFRLIKETNDFQVIDLRGEEEYKKSNIPSSINIPSNSLMDKQWYDYIRKNNKELIFYSDNSEDAEKAYFIAKEFGHDYNAVLEKGYEHFVNTFANPTADTSSIHIIQGKWDLRFRERAKTALEEMRKKYAEMQKPKKKKAVRVVGGC